MKIHRMDYWKEDAVDSYVSNGFIGFRIAKNPFEQVTGLLNGFTTLREKEVQGWAVLPTPKLTFLYGEKAVEPEILEQSYDFSVGEFTTTAKLCCGEKKVTVNYTLYCSRTSPTLLISHLMFSGEAVKIGVDISYAVHDKYTHTVGEALYFGGRKDRYDGKCLQYSADRTSAAGIAFRVFGDAPKQETGDLSEHVELEAMPEGTEIQLVTSYVPSVMHDEPHNQAQRMIQLVAWQGIPQMREANRKAWESLWESRITIDGAGEKWQDVLDASFFYLMSSVSEFSPFSVSPYGLSNPVAYSGHIFWDTESYMFMPPLFCAPNVARSMLDYRYKRIPAAENNALLNGYRGIQFPWQSGTSGCEVTPPWALQAGEHHVNFDVGLAFDAYARVSGDEGYIREKVWPVMRGVAEWIESRVVKTERGYEILHITGIDEEVDDVNNDSYSNIMAAKVLRSAAGYAKMLGLGERKKWNEIADGMFIPMREDGVLEQYEGMPDVPKQHPTALMSYFPYGYTENQYTTLDYYIRRGMYDYCCYPMLSGFLGVFPAWNGDRETSLKFYEEANLTFFCEPFYSCTEWSTNKAHSRVKDKKYKTNFITARGSLLSGLIMGLTKMCPWKGDVAGPLEEWFGEDIVLPKGWTKITVGKIYLRGKAYRLTAEHGAKRAVLEER